MLNPLVNFTAVADVMQINPAEFQIEFVEHTVVANAEFEFRPPLQPFVRKIFQPRSHLVNLALNGFADTSRQIVKRF